MENQEMFSDQRLTADNRTYYVDIKQNYKGERYVKLVENRILENGKLIQQQVLIFEDDLNKIMDAVKAALQIFPVARSKYTTINQVK